MSLDQFREAATALILLALVIAALALALDGFQDSIEEDGACTIAAAVYNTTSSRCEYGSNSTVYGGPNEQFNISNEGLTGIANATSYLSTIGTLIGVAALIAIVVSAFLFIRK